MTWDPVEDLSEPVGHIPSAFDALITQTNVLPLLSLNPLGEVQAGSTITLLAHVKPVTYRFLRGYRYPRHADVEIDIYDQYLELLGSGVVDIREIDLHEDCNVRDEIAEKAKRVNVDFSTLETCHAARITERRADVAVSDRSMFQKDTVSKKVIWFLLVKRPESREGLWTRVGVGSTHIRNCEMAGYFDGTRLQEITLI